MHKQELVMDEKDLVFSIYIIAGPNGPIPAVTQHKNTNLSELEMVANALKDSVARSKLEHVIRMPEQQPQPPAQSQPSPPTQPKPLTRDPNIDDGPDEMPEDPHNV